MKKRIGFLLASLMIFISGHLIGQEWLGELDPEKLDRSEVSFFEIQKAFNEYWTPRNVSNGYYELGGETQKAYGWKQYKRWEWFWESRVDVENGNFPATTPYYELQKYKEQHPRLKNGTPTGNWTSLGPYNSNGGYAGIGRLNCVAFHPTQSNTIYVGAAAGGIWKTTDGGGSWTSLSDDNAVLGVSDIVVLDNGISETIYIATGDRDHYDNYSVGVLKSTDGGFTWNTTGLNWGMNYGRVISRLLIDPVNSDILYAATSYGLYKTSDAGASWLKMSTVRFDDLEFKPDDSSIIFGSTKSAGEVYRSLDAGISWTRVLQSIHYDINNNPIYGSRAHLAVSPDNPDIVYSLICGSDGGLFGIYKSSNGGSSFIELQDNSPNMLAWNCNGSDSGGQGWYDLCIAADPNNADRVFFGGVNTWGSSDGGLTWDIKNVWSGNCGGSAQEVHADKHFLAFQNSSSTLFECNDGGLYRSDDSGKTWTDLSNGLEISQLYRLGVAQTSSGYAVGGLQDNGTKALSGGSWKDVIGGDGMDCAIDPTNHNIQYGALYYGRIYRTTNNWSSASNITTQFSNAGAWVTPYALDPNNPSVIYVGYSDVWRNDLAGSAGWEKISSLGSSTLRSIAIAPSNSDVICAANQSTLYRTTNGGSSWTTIPRPVSSTITFISIDSDDPDHMWISFGQFNSYGVFETLDGGNSWNNISAGLPQIPVNCVIENRQNTQEMELYAATDVGVYIKLGNNDWIPFSEGLPNVVVSELEIYYDSDPANSKIVAATFGRGMWESNLFESALNPVSFTQDPIIAANASEDSPYISDISSFVNYSGSNTLTYSKETGPEWLIVDPSSGSLSGTPVNDDVGQNTFTVKVDAGTNGTDQSQLEITVINTNDPPIFITDPIEAQAANEGSLYSGTLQGMAEDADGDNLIFSKVSGPDWLIIGSNGILSGTPQLEDREANQWIVQVNDGNGGTDNALLNIFVFPVNHPPVFNSNPIVLDDALEDILYVGTIAGDVTDPDADNLVFTKVSGPAWLAISINGSITGTPAQEDVAINSFIVRVNDGRGGTDETTLQINVQNINDPPVFTNSIITRPDANMESAFSATIAGEATDSDLDPISYAAVSGPAWLQVSSDGSLSGTPFETDVGLNTWTVSASDASETVTAQLQIEVLFVNHAPVFTSNPINEVPADEDAVYSASISDDASDIDLQELVFGKESGPDWLIVSPNGDLSGIPLQGNIGSNTFVVSVNDGNGGTAQANLLIYVNNINDDPVFNNSSISLTDATVNSYYSETIAGEATDEDMDVLSYSILSGPTWLSMSTDGAVYGTPAISDEQSNFWTIQVIDGNGGVAEATLNIFVRNPAEYCNVSGWNSSNQWIEGVTFNGLSSTTGNNGGYLSVDSPVYQFDANSIVNFTLSPGYPGRSSFVYWNIWIDNNGDGDYDDQGENVYSSVKKKNDLLASLTVSGLVGRTAMRISVSDNAGADPCSIGLNGEVEDYIVEISAAGPKPPVAQFTADNTSVTPGSTVTFTDLSSNNPTNLLWDFGNNQTSTLTNPSVTYSTVGVYTVSLTASNNEGTDTETKIDYITVAENTGGLYCEPANIDNTSDYIAGISIGSMTGAIGSVASGYEYYIDPKFTLSEGQTYNVSLTPSNNRSRCFWRIWIDVNGDGSFDGSGETLLTANNKKGVFNGTLTIPSGFIGDTRIRISMKVGSSQLSCDGDFIGEVEDYDLQVVPGPVIGMLPLDEKIGKGSLELNIFPNPVKEILTVQTELITEESTVRIYNLLGQDMLWIRLNSDYTEIDVKTFEKGIYFLVYQSQGQTEVRKFVKE